MLSRVVKFSLILISLLILTQTQTQYYFKLDILCLHIPFLITWMAKSYCINTVNVNYDAVFGRVIILQSHTIDVLLKLGAQVPVATPPKLV